MARRLHSDLSKTGIVLSAPRSIPAGPNSEMRQLFDGAAFGAVFESSGEALVVVDTTGAVHRTNRHARRILRMEGNGLPQRNLANLIASPQAADLLSWFRQSAEQAESSATGGESLEAALAGGFPFQLTLRAVLPGSDHLLVCIEDNVRGRRAEERTRQLEAELSSLLDALEAGVILFDSSGGIRFVNDRFGQLFGLRLRGAQAAHTFDEIKALVSERFSIPEAFARRWEQFSAGEETPSQDELELVRPVRKVLERYSRPVLSRRGAAAGWLELYYDVTTRREIQSKLLQTEKMAALGQLVSGIAHELNNPLTAIMGYAQLLLGHGLARPQQVEADKVFHEAERARRIVKNLLYFARENKPERVRVDLNEIVEKALALRSYELRVENILVECELAAGLPGTVGDPYQLQQVVLNLLVNAEQALLEYRGQGRIWIRSHRISPEKVTLEVSDDGPGIPAGIASRIFDPFFTTKPAGIGTGLGLSIAYGIVKQHGGEISLESHRGAGARFVIELPVSSSVVERPASTPPEAGSQQQVVRGRVLVVEDEATVAQLIVDVLREEGHEAEAASDSQEGLTRLARAHYDLVICDLRMPRLDGPAFYDALVRAGSPVRHRIIFVTGDTLAPRSLEFLDSHKLPYLAKPFLVEELKLAVHRILERDSADAAAANMG